MVANTVPTDYAGMWSGVEISLHLFETECIKITWGIVKERTIGQSCISKGLSKHMQSSSKTLKVIKNVIYS